MSVRVILRDTCFHDGLHCWICVTCRGVMSVKIKQKKGNVYKNLTGLSGSQLKHDCYARVRQNDRHERGCYVTVTTNKSMF